MNTNTNHDHDPDGPPQDAAPENTGADTKPNWPPWAPAVIESMRAVPSLARASREIGVDRRTIQRLQAKDDRFALALADARDDALDTLEEVMLLRARTGQPTKKTVTKTLADGSVEVTVTDDYHLSDTCGIFYLKRWRPEYREAFKAEITGAGGGPVQIMSVQEIDDRIARLTRELSATNGHAVAVDE